LRNPLADPHILGSSAGGALGAVLASVTGVSALINAYIGVPLFSFIGSLAAISLVYALSKRKGFLSMYSLILVGVILNSFFISIVIFIETLISADQLASIFFWLLGNLSHYEERLFLILCLTFFVSFSVLFLEARNINLLSLSEDKAAQLGVPVERTKKICFIFASIITGMAVALSGLIGFVGLVVPHIMRLMWGPDHRLLIPASTISGGIFLILADTIARTIVIPQELPVGVVTSFIGAPFFIVLLKRKEGQGMS
jgi:iron complex transport system permease protein